MKLLSEPLTASFYKIKKDNPGKRLVLLELGVWVQMKDGRWQCVIQVSEGRNYLLEKDDIKPWMKNEDFQVGCMPNVIAQ